MKESRKLRLNTIYLYCGICFLLFNLVACSTPEQVQKPVPLSIPTARLYLPTYEPKEKEAIEAPMSQSDVTEAFRVTTYQFEVLFDVNAKQLQVSETIHYLNLTDVALTEISMLIPPNREAGQFELRGFMVGERNTPPPYTMNGELLIFSLPEPLNPHEMISIALQYMLTLPNRRGVLGYTERQINVCDWYAFIPPYQAERGWMVNPYHPIGEYLVYDVADYEVEIKLAEMDPMLIIATGQPGQFNGESTLYRLDHARTFAWSASYEYQVLAQAENPSVIAYVLPEHVSAGWAALSAVISARNLYSAIYAAYSHDGLALVEADFDDGMEYDGLFFVGSEYFESYNGGEKNYLTAISAHETAHQWWFAAVGNDAANQPWLDESLAIYSEMLFYETYYPADVDWWWSFRVAPFYPVGWVDSTVYEYDAFRPYINAVYLRGAQFMDEIRRTIGDEAFFSFLQAYYRAGSGNIMTRQDFFALLAEYTDADIQPIVARYFSE